MQKQCTQRASENSLSISGWTSAHWQPGQLFLDPSLAAKRCWWEKTNRPKKKTLSKSLYVKKIYIYYSNHFSLIKKNRYFWMQRYALVPSCIAISVQLISSLATCWPVTSNHRFMWPDSQPGTYPSDGHLQANTVCCCSSIYRLSPHIICNAFAVADLIKIYFKCVFVEVDLELQQNPCRDMQSLSAQSGDAIETQSLHFHLRSRHAK